MSYVVVPVYYFFNILKRPAPRVSQTCLQMVYVLEYRSAIFYGIFLINIFSTSTRVRCNSRIVLVNWTFYKNYDL